jgi:hypothetical protein
VGGVEARLSSREKDLIRASPLRQRVEDWEVVSGSRNRRSHPFPDLNPPPRARNAVRAWLAEALLRSTNTQRLTVLGWALLFTVPEDLSVSQLAIRAERHRSTHHRRLDRGPRQRASPHLTVRERRLQYRGELVQVQTPLARHRDRDDVEAIDLYRVRLAFPAAPDAIAPRRSRQACPQGASYRRNAIDRAGHDHACL